jgi:hypothetical protein
MGYYHLINMHSITIDDRNISCVRINVSKEQYSVSSSSMITNLLDAVSEFCFTMGYYHPINVHSITVDDGNISCVRINVSKEQYSASSSSMITNRFNKHMCSPYKLKKAKR